MYLSVYLSIYLSIYLFCLSVYLSIYSVFLQDLKRRNSARLPQFPKMATSKTKQCGEASFNFRSWQHQKRSNSARLPSKMESSVHSWRPRTYAFCFFSISSVQSAAPATQKWRQVIRSAAPVTQNHLSKPEDVMLQNAMLPPKISAWPPNISDEQVSCTAPATWNSSLQILCKCPTLAIVFGHATKPSHFAHFWQRAESLVPATQNDIWTSKSGPNMWCF